MKKNGMLLHISSLPSDFGIGDFGPNAYQFVDYLNEKKFCYWQILPLYQPGYGNSPYNPVSAFALNPYLISPELLYEDGLIDLPDMEEAKLPSSNQIPYEAVYRLKDNLLKKAANNYLSDIEIYEYIESNAFYLKPYLAYLTLCKLYGDDDWHNFRPEHRHYSDKLYDTLFKNYGSQILRMASIQALAKDQLLRLKDYMNSQGIQLIGDMPLYLSYHSADVWANQHLFDLDENGNRLNVAGVPPDAFSQDGQLWGNPIYKWDKMKEDGFQLFINRIKNALNYLDKLRLDHFIGYINFWCIPCSRDEKSEEPILPENALKGEWKKAAPEDFFPVIMNTFSPEVFIVEDLGILNDEVCYYRDYYKLPGMIILQFCFEEQVPEIRKFPPERYIYTGTHDNPTTQEWYANLSDDSPSKINLLRFINEHPLLFSGLGLETEEDIKHSIHLIMCIIAEASGCQNVVLPVQDILGLDASGRMNVPGTALGNWQWRLESFDDLFSKSLPWE